jgi:hypothetical protein
MVHRLLLIKLKSECTPQQLENMMIETRMRLLKVPEVLNLQCGKKIKLHGNDHDMFIGIDVENTTKAKVLEDSAIYLQFQHQVLNPNSANVEVIDFEMEPGKDVQFS